MDDFEDEDAMRERMKVEEIINREVRNIGEMD